MSLWVSGCGGPRTGAAAFEAPFPDNRQELLGKVVGQIAQAPVREAPGLAAGLFSNGDLFVWDLSQSSLRWREPSSSRSTPYVAGSYIITHEERGVVGRDVQTGRVLFETDDEALHLVGADGEGDRAAVVLSTGEGVGAHSTLLAIQGGQIAWAQRVDHPLGSPVVRGALILVPWSNQNISVLHASTGREWARFRSRSAAIHTLFVDRGDVWVGGSRLFRLDARLLRKPHPPQLKDLPWLADLPGQPALVPKAPAPEPTAESAVHRVRLAWRPAYDENVPGVGMDDDRIYYAFYRAVVGFESESGTMAWAREHAHDVIALRALEAGVLLADEQGGLMLLSRTDGQPRWTANLGEPVGSVRLAVSRVAAQPTAVPSPGPHRAPEGPLAALVRSRDARLVPVQRLALGQLASIDGPRATEALIELCDDPQVLEPVRKVACRELGDRTAGAESVLKALGRHASFLTSATSPPLAALARASVAMNEKRAVPLLLAHLADPQTSLHDLPALLIALGRLGEAATAGPAIVAFLRLYHAEAEDEALSAALRAATDVAATLETTELGPVLEELTRDPHTMPSLREHAQVKLDRLQRTPQQEEPSGPPEASSEDKPPADAKP